MDENCHGDLEYFTQFFWAGFLLFCLPRQSVCSLLAG